MQLPVLLLVFVNELTLPPVLYIEFS